MNAKHSGGDDNDHDGDGDDAGSVLLSTYTFVWDDDNNGDDGGDDDCGGSVDDDGGDDDDDDDGDDDSHYIDVYPQIVYVCPPIWLPTSIHPSMNPLIEQTRLSAIKLKHFHMLRTELTLRPDHHHHHHQSNNNNHHHHQSTTGNHHNHNRNRNHHRRGIYLDDVLWRFVNKLLAELLYNNTLSMMILITSAAANHTTNVIDKARY